MCAIEVIVPGVIVNRVVDELRSYIATRDGVAFTQHILTRLIARVAARRSVPIR